MIKLIRQIILTILLSFMFEKFFPWWTIVISSGIISMCLRSSNGFSFFVGFVSISILWMTYASVIDIKTHSILSTKMTGILNMKNIAFLIIFTGFIGGIVAGLGALIGQILRKRLFADNRPLS